MTLSFWFLALCGAAAAVAANRGLVEALADAPLEMRQPPSQLEHDHDAAAEMAAAAPTPVSLHSFAPFSAQAVLL